MANFIGSEKIAALGAGPRYRVYQDKAPCHHCREGGTWSVLDTVEDSLIGGISYHQEEDAEWLADQLNDAATAAGAHIRHALLDAVGQCEEAHIAGGMGDGGWDVLILKEAFLAHLDRIIPEEG